MFLCGALSNLASMSGFLLTADWTWKARWQVAVVLPLVAGPSRRRLRALDAGVPPVLFERWRRWGAQVFLAVRPGFLLLFPKQACVHDAPLPPSTRRRRSDAGWWGSRRRYFPTGACCHRYSHHAETSFTVYPVGLAGSSGGRCLSTVVVTVTTDPGRVSRDTGLGKRKNTPCAQEESRGTLGHRSPGRVTRHWTE